MDARDILKKPIITEKSNLIKTEGAYTFIVDKSANKIQIKAAVETIFDVKVESVNIINCKPKKRSMQFGRIVGFSSSKKKAMVKLKDKQTISELEV